MRVSAVTQSTTFTAPIYGKWGAEQDENGAGRPDHYAGLAARPKGGTSKAVLR